MIRNIPDGLIGRPISRKEDTRLLTGKGRFTDDFNLENQAYAVMVRSPHPHAVIKSIDIETAQKMDGILGVYIGEDCIMDGLSEIPHSPLPKTDNDLKLRARDDKEVFIGPHMLLPCDKVRHVGEAIAMVVADNRYQAMNAAETINIDFEVLQFNLDGLKAANGEASPVWDELPSNTCIDATFGDVLETEKIISTARHVVRAEFYIDRVTGVPIEPRAAIGSFDKETERYTIYAGSGGAVRQKHELAHVLGVLPEKVRVLSYDVGGNFGTRNRVYVEFGLVAWAAKKIGRPVKYISDRSEAFVSDYQGRDLYSKVQLALDENGSFLAMSADNISNVGARAVSFSPLGKGSALISGSYRIPVACVRARAVFTNTIPTQAYRSSGRPEVTYVIEQLIEKAADQVGIDAQKLKEINLISQQEMPYTNPIGLTYDSGDYHKSVNLAKKMAAWDDREKRREISKQKGKLRGIGFANYVESSIGSPVEQAEVYIKPEGIVELVIGTQPSGQGHETSFAQVAADWFGLSLNEVKIIIGDTDIVKIGGGSHSGRSMRMAGTVIVRACDEVIEKGQKLASELLEASISDIEFSNGEFFIKGTDSKISLFEIANNLKKSKNGKFRSSDLDVIKSNEMHTPVVPNGCHICEVELDPETGEVKIVNYVAVDDVGRAINPMIVHGQTHGAIVQGLGQAMLECCVNNLENGQILSGSLLDYGIPRAGDVPHFNVELNEIHSPTNPLGIKAGGEGGTTSAPAVYMSAVFDALKVYDIRELKMPVTPHNIWQTIQNTKKFNV